MQLDTVKDKLFMRLASVNRAEILWLNTHEFLPAKPVPGAQCRALTGDDMRKLCQVKDFDIDPQLAKDFESLGFEAIGMFVNDKLVGLSCFAAENVPAQYNKQNDYLNGLDVTLPPGSRYLFNSIILPAFRGQRLHSAVVRYAIDHFGKDTVHTIFTHYDVKNKAFLNSSLDQGFERVGTSVEFCFLGKSLYRLPKPVDCVTGEIGDDREDERAIVMSKAA